MPRWREGWVALLISRLNSGDLDDAPPFPLLLSVPALAFSAVPDAGDCVWAGRAVGLAMGDALTPAPSSSLSIRDIVHRGKLENNHPSITAMGYSAPYKYS